MLDQENEKNKEEAKHVKFPHAARKVQNQAKPTRVSRKSPVYHSEVQKYESETLENIRIFKEARKNWMLLKEGSETRRKPSEETISIKQTDNRRLNMKKLGLKPRMIQSHRMSLRPKVCLTFKKTLNERELSTAQEQLEAQTAALQRNRKENLRKEFRKMAIKYHSRVAKEKKKAAKARKRTKSKVNLGGKEKETDKTSTSEDKTELDEDGLTAYSQEKFDKYVRKLGHKSITGEDVADMKFIWKEYKNQLTGEPTKDEGQSKKEKSLKSPTKKKMKNFFNCFKKMKRIRSEAKCGPCRCQHIGDSVIIQKNGCKSLLEIEKMRTGIVNNQKEKERNNELPHIIPKPQIDRKSSVSSPNIVDSLEVIRRKFSQSLPSLKNQEISTDGKHSSSNEDEAFSIPSTSKKSSQEKHNRKVKLGKKHKPRVESSGESSAPTTDDEYSETSRVKPNSDSENKDGGKVSGVTFAETENVVGKDAPELK